MQSIMFYAKHPNCNIFRLYIFGVWVFNTSFLQASQFHPTSQNHASRWLNYATLPIDMNKCLTVLCPAVDWHPIQVWQAFALCLCCELLDK